jgi:hypothetical protein
MPNVLRAAATLIAAFPPQNRIAKNLQSLYSQSQPPPAGIVHLWRFTTGRMEAKAIAESCRDLIAAGISPKQILILLSNRRALGPEIIAHLQGANVPFTVAAAQEFRDADVGRLFSLFSGLSATRTIMSPIAYCWACVREWASARVTQYAKQ